MKISVYLRTGLLAGAFFIITMTNGWAIDENAEEIDMRRAPGSSTLTKSEVVSRIKTDYKGRILSISTNDKGGEDCHVVKILTITGEFKTIHVSCKF